MTHHRKEIDMEKVHKLLDAGYKINPISYQMGVDQSTIKRRLAEENDKH